MHIITTQLLNRCETNDHLVALYEYFDLKVHDTERAGDRMKVYFEPDVPGGKIDCVSLPIELFKPESYMPKSTLNWLKLIGG